MDGKYLIAIVAAVLVVAAVAYFGSPHGQAQVKTTATALQSTTAPTSQQTTAKSSVVTSLITSTTIPAAPASATGTCTSSYAQYTCSKASIYLYKGAAAPYGYLLFNLTHTIDFVNTNISVSYFPGGPAFCYNATLPNMPVGVSTELNISIPSACLLTFSNISGSSRITLYLFAYNQSNYTYSSLYSIKITANPVMLSGS